MKVLVRTLKCATLAELNVFFLEFQGSSPLRNQGSVKYINPFCEPSRMVHQDDFSLLVRFQETLKFTETTIFRSVVLGTLSS